MDPSLVPTEINEFVARIKSLFLDKVCFELGYVRVMLAHLQSVSIIPGATRNQRMRSLGGKHFSATSPEAVVALDHICCWVKMSLDTIEAEFPEQEMMMAMSAFVLYRTTKHARYGYGGESGDSAALLRHIQRIATYLKVDNTKLLSQFHVLYPSALDAFKDNDELTTLGAWQAALGRWKRRHVKLESLDLITRALSLFAAYESCTTSNTERSFAHQKRLSGEHRHLSIATEGVETALTWCFQPEDRAQVVENARLVYAASFGPPRQSCLDRRDKGHKKKKQHPLRYGQRMAVQATNCVRWHSHISIFGQCEEASFQHGRRCVERKDAG